jgi:hypothetical protein
MPGRRSERSTLINPLAVGFVSLSLSSCLHEVAHLPFTAEGAKAVVTNLHSGSVRFAADVTVKYDTLTVAYYDIDLLQHGSIVAHTTCDPFHVAGSRVCSYEYRSKDGGHDFDCSFVMACEAVLDAGGPTLVRARFVVSTRGAGFALKQAELVIGQ